MIANRTRRLFAAALLGLSSNAGGCAVYEMSGWKLPQARVPDVRPVLRERSDDAVADFDRRRNQAQYLAAQTSWKQGDFDRCVEALNKILDRDPGHREALLLLADVKLETDKPDEAVEALRLAVAADPHDPEIAYRLGVALETIGDVADAIPYLRQAANANPEDTQLAADLAEAEELLRAEAEPPRKTATTKKADANVVPVAHEEPLAVVNDAPRPASVIDTEFAAALADWEQNRVVECAGRLRELLERQPDHVEANILQAEIDLNGGQASAALRRMDRLVVKHPRNVQVRQACGLVNEAAGNVEKAKLFFAEAESLAETDALVAVAYDEPASATSSLTIASTASSSEPRLLPVGSEVLTPPEFPQLTKLASATVPEVDLSGEPAALLTDGQSALAEGKIEAAKQLLRAAVARTKDDPHTVVTASVAALKLEQPELALELATTGTTAFPRNAGLHRIRGMAAYRLGRYADAESALQQSLHLDKSPALSYFLLGSAQSRLGKSESAERNFSEAARLDARYAKRK